MTLREVDGRDGGSVEGEEVEVGDEGRYQSRRKKRKEGSSKAKEDLIVRTSRPPPVTRADVGFVPSCRTRADSWVLLFDLLLPLLQVLPRLLRRDSLFSRRKVQDDLHLLVPLSLPAQQKEDDLLRRPSLGPKGWRKGGTTFEGGLGTEGKGGWDEVGEEEGEEEDGSHRRRILRRRDERRQRSSLRRRGRA